MMFETVHCAVAVRLLNEMRTAKKAKRKNVFMFKIKRVKNIFLFHRIWKFQKAPHK